MVQWDTLLPENKQTPFGVTRFLRFTLWTRTTENGDTSHILLHWSSLITSDLILLLFFLYLVYDSDTKSAPFPPVLTYPMKANDFHLPAL